MANRLCLRRCVNCGKEGHYATTAHRIRIDGEVVYCGYYRVVRE
jgi:hypothetical protein